jgi:hypothetical protein
VVENLEGIEDKIADSYRFGIEGTEKSFEIADSYSFEIEKSLEIVGIESKIAGNFEMGFG